MLRLFTLALFVSSAAAQPIAVEASVDPGPELVALGLWLSGSYPTPPDSDYKTDAWVHFGPHRDHPGLDAFREAEMYPDATELGLLLDPEGGTRREIPAGLVWTEHYGRDMVQTMLDGLLSFARDADFAAFRQRHQAEYARWQADAERSLRAGGALDTLDAFFRMSGAGQKPSVHVVLEPLNQWGAHAITEPALVAEVGGPGWVVYEVGPATWNAPQLPDSPLSFARDDGALAWHEASHTYLRSTLDAHAVSVAALDRLFDEASEALQQQNITTWRYAFEENLVRAVGVALTRQVRGDEAAGQMARREEARGFVYVDRISDLIEEEYLGGDRSAGFDAFVPRILEDLAALEGPPRPSGPDGQ